MKLCLPALCLFFMATLLSAQKVEDSFEAKSFSDGDFSLNYRIYIPSEIKPGETVPLVLLLHGAGERGDNNLSQLVNGAGSIFRYSRHHKIPAIIIAPQCPAGMQWVDVPWNGDSHVMPKEPSKPMHATMQLLAESIKNLPVDRSRIYVTGLSMGGFGTWDIIQRNPELFAAAIPVCGGGDQAEAAQLKDLPIWVFHGAEDTAVKTQRSRDMVDAVKKNGGTHIQYTEYPGVAHFSWKQTYANPEVLKWLFEQRK